VQERQERWFFVGAHQDVRVLPEVVMGDVVPALLAPTMKKFGRCAVDRSGWLLVLTAWPQTRAGRSAAPYPRGQDTTPAGAQENHARPVGGCGAEN